MMRTSTDHLASDLQEAIVRRRPVTLSYTKEDGTETIRTIEPYALVVTGAGNDLIRTLERQSNTYRSFRLDRVHAYTVHHRGRFHVPDPIAEEALDEAWGDWLETTYDPDLEGAGS